MACVYNTTWDSSTSTTGSKRHHPYDSSQRSRKAHSKSPPSAPVTSNTSSSSLLADEKKTTETTLLSSTRRTKPLHTMREVAEKTIRKHYPYFTPRNDWEVLYLSSVPYSGSEAGLYERLDNYLALEIKERGSYKAVIRRATKDLDEPLDMTGVSFTYTCARYTRANHGCSINQAQGIRRSSSSPSPVVNTRSACSQETPKARTTASTSCLRLPANRSTRHSSSISSASLTRTRQ